MSKLCGLSMERMWQKLGIVDEAGSNLCHAKEMLCFRHPRETIAASGGTAVGGGEELRKKVAWAPVNQRDADDRRYFLLTCRPIKTILVEPMRDWFDEGG